MEAIQKIFRIGGGRSQPVRKRTHQGNEFGSYTSEKRRAPLSKVNWTCENELYRFPIEECPKDPWEQCYDVVDKSDDDLCKDLKDEISWLLIVASLFLGIVTAFTIESFKWLRADEEQTTVALLGDMVKLLNSTSAQGTVPERSLEDFTPKDHDIVVNQLWFLSMTLSLSAVIAGTLCLQWLSAFRRKYVKHRPHLDALALRQLRYEGFMGWGVPHVPAFLLLTVQGALVLFAIGLLYLLWSVNKRVAVPVAIVSGVSVTLLILTTAMPLLQSVIGWIFPSTLAVPQCPYKSPIAWVVHRGCALMAIICSLPFSWLPWFRDKMAVWRHQQVELLTDYTWQVYDDLWRRQRERWGPQASKKYSYYLVHGLASAMEELVFQPSAVHIIHTCLQDFHGTKGGAQTFEDLFGDNITSEEKGLLEDIKTEGKVAENLRFSTSHLRNLRRDFLNAHALQHFVSHNPKLRRALLPHRVELYIRIKNSSRNSEPLTEKDQGMETQTHYDEKSQYIGTSIKCPIESIRDAEALSSELRLQFLKFAEWFLGTDRCKEADANGVRLVLEVSKNVQSPSDIQFDDEPSLEDRLKRVLGVLDQRLRESSRREAQSSTNTLYGGREENSPTLDHGPDLNHPSPTASNDPSDDMLPQSSIPPSLCDTVDRELQKHWKPAKIPDTSRTPRRRQTARPFERSLPEDLV